MLRSFNIWVVVLCLALPTRAQGQGAATHFVVIGSFRNVDNAIRFTAAANGNGYTARYAFDPTPAIYYVYVLETADKVKADEFADKIKKETYIKSAWVFSGKLNAPANANAVAAVVNDPVGKDAASNSKYKAVNAAGGKLSADDSLKFQAKIDSAFRKRTTAKPFYFKVVSKRDGKEITTTLQLQETDEHSGYQTVKSGEMVYLKEPHNPQRSYRVAAMLPGYRQSSVVFLFNSPPIETGPNHEDVVTLTLDTARADNYMSFNNVHFFRNASILRPVSQTELNQLARIMQENGAIKIKVHGYCNGNQEREAMTMGASTNYFAMDPTTNKKDTISSMNLSVARAETVKAYLITQNIGAERIDIKGEGGTTPLYPENGKLALYNDRIEVEFEKN